MLSTGSNIFFLLFLSVWFQRKEKQKKKYTKKRVNNTEKKVLLTLQKCVKVIEKIISFVLYTQKCCQTSQLSMNLAQKMRWSVCWLPRFHKQCKAPTQILRFAVKTTESDARNTFAIWIRFCLCDAIVVGDWEKRFFQIKRFQILCVSMECCRWAVFLVYQSVVHWPQTPTATNAISTSCRKWIESKPFNKHFPTKRPKTSSRMKKKKKMQ